MYSIKRSEGEGAKPVHITHTVALLLGYLESKNGHFRLINSLQHSNSPSAPSPRCPTSWLAPKRHPDLQPRLPPHLVYHEALPDRCSREGLEAARRIDLQTERLARNRILVSKRPQWEPGFSARWTQAQDVHKRAEDR